MTIALTHAETARLTARDALTGVLATELRASKETLLLGETIRYIGASGVTRGLFDEFGPEQVIETPVSENALLGAALGLALAGFRPIIEIYCADFLLAVANEVMNDIPKWRQQQARGGGMPITIRGPMGSDDRGGLGPEHSQSMEPFLHHAPGLVVVTPGTPRDAAGLLRAAIRSPEPVVFLEDRKLYPQEGEVPTDPDFTIPLGVAEVVREGADVTLVAWGGMRREAEAAADVLERRGIAAEVLDPRTISPMDWDAVLASVERTGRLLVAEEAPITGSVGAEILARVAEAGLDRAPAMARVAMDDVISPYSASMEAEILPRRDDIVAAAVRLCERRDR
jgi:pyruvate dehydrogenase E1 component beta subunit